VERRAVDGGPAVRGGLDVETRHQIDIEPLVGAADVRVFGVLLDTLREHRVAHLEPEPFQFLAVERRREPDEQVHVAVTREPRPAGRRADLEHVRLVGR